MDNYLDEFKISQFKFTHYYWFDDDNFAGVPRETSVELKKVYDEEERCFVWNKIVSHTYISLKDVSKLSTDSYSEKTSDDVISSLEKFDLREYRNNFFSNDIFYHSNWEIVYNHKFKIVGTYDNMIDIVKYFYDTFSFKKIMDVEREKVGKLLDNLNGDYDGIN